MGKETAKNENLMTADYYRTKLQRDIVLDRLRKNGCRITKQRKMLLDIILQEDCASCKEIYYRASKEDASIGVATVYRMINLLEEIGAISRKNMYRISYSMDSDEERACVVELDDETVCTLTPDEWHKVVSEGLRHLGYVVGCQKVANVSMESV